MKSTTVFLLAAVLSFLGCSFIPAQLGKMNKPEAAVKAAEVQGFRNIKVIDRDIYFVAWKGCGQSDTERLLKEGQ